MINCIGAGLAGCEAAYQIAKRGECVTLYDMKPKVMSPAHSYTGFSELVCSNSLRSDRLSNAAGLLKEEMRLLDSLILRAADAVRVKAGGALAVDRKMFSDYITDEIRKNPYITIVADEVKNIPEGKTIIATGPLTDGALLKSIESVMGEPLHFFDAAAPIVTAESLNMDVVFSGSRYERGDDYLNCPMNQKEYFDFLRALIGAETAVLHEFERGDVFEGCMPIEIMAKRGDLTLAYGPLKPVGLVDLRKNDRAFAVVQLRRENEQGTLYNLVGFQTNLKFADQKRVFSMIPGLENAQFVRYGVMHRNTFLNSPGKLTVGYRVKSKPELYFAGQITGVEGYIESAASGLIAGICAVTEKDIDFTGKTAIGALSHYISGYSGKDFQPQNINFGIMEPLSNKVKNKQDRYLAISDRAIYTVKTIQNENNL
ncbi:MAG: methylenetetrahydrofolate--tRNA-(uracil(54)-C(5))-methyltransferase (FADH(2)-oxidizing) TrmFO [Clostridia bacterium]